MIEVPNTATGPDVYETTKAIEQQLRMLGYTRGTVEWDGALAAARSYIGRATPATVTIGFEDAQRLFDLAIDSPLVCSGSFETDDVVVLRKLAALIGVDPTKATPDEFAAQYPHPHKRRTVFAEMRINETGEQAQARIAEERADPTCQVGTYGRRCGKPEADPIHQPAPVAAVMGA